MIWFKNYTIKDLEAFLQSKGIVQLLNIKIINIAPDSLQASMPVDERTWQVDGIMHGGSTCVLVESVGSFASRMCLDPEIQYSVGSFITVNHIRPIRGGVVIATCKPVHLGRQKHVWDIMVHNAADQKLIAKGELTCSVQNGKLS